MFLERRRVLSPLYAGYKFTGVSHTAHYQSTYQLAGDFQDLREEYHL
jgi:hypothetical protein